MFFVSDLPDELRGAARDAAAAAFFLGEESAEREPGLDHMMSVLEPFDAAGRPLRHFMGGDTATRVIDLGVTVTVKTKKADPRDADEAAEDWLPELECEPQYSPWMNVWGHNLRLKGLRAKLAQMTTADEVYAYASLLDGRLDADGQPLEMTAEIEAVFDKRLEQLRRAQPRQAVQPQPAAQPQPRPLYLKQRDGIWLPLVLERGNEVRVVLRPSALAKAEAAGFRRIRPLAQKPITLAKNGQTATAWNAGYLRERLAEGWQVA